VQEGRGQPNDRGSLELVRSIVGAWERGDFGNANWADPEIEFVVDDVLSRETWAGVSNLGRGWLTFLSSWEEYRVQLEGLRELDEARILALVRHGGRGRRSGLEIGSITYEGAVLFELGSAGVRRLVAYLDRKRAFADLVIEP
jgi:hypothetical protein